MREFDTSSSPHFHWHQIQGQESCANRILYVPLVLGHSLAHYLLSLVEATVVVTDDAVMREGVGYYLLVVALVGMRWWECLMFGRHIVLAKLVMISRASASVLMLWSLRFCRILIRRHLTSWFQ